MHRELLFHPNLAVVKVFAGYCIVTKQETPADSAIDDVHKRDFSQGRLIQAASPEGVINYAYDPITGQKTRMWTTKAAGLDAANLA